MVNGESKSCSGLWSSSSKTGLSFDTSSLGSAWGSAPFLLDINPADFTDIVLWTLARRLLPSDVEMTQLARGRVDRTWPVLGLRIGVAKQFKHPETEDDFPCVSRVGLDSDLYFAHSEFYTVQCLLCPAFGLNVLQQISHCWFCVLHSLRSCSPAWEPHGWVELGKGSHWIVAGWTRVDPEGGCYHWTRPHSPGLCWTHHCLRLGHDSICHSSLVKMSIRGSLKEKFTSRLKPSW